MTDLTKIEKPFGLLDEATQKALRECGGPWQYFGRDGWKDAPFLDENTDYFVYRLKPTPREWWIGKLDGVAYPAEPPQAPPKGSYYIHVREVMPE